uniref:Uncharacterized protein n=1 Tax=Romanomermis culicivorax TaxID=13658 RepID=A0A915K715_ROMCU
MPDGQLLEYNVLKILPFDSQRKRMSVLVELPTIEIFKKKFSRRK